HLVVGMPERADSPIDLDVCPYFSDGTLRHVKEAHRVSIRAALISLRQITRDTDRTPPNLIAKTEVFLEVLAFRYTIHSHRQIFCQLPHEQILKSLLAHGLVSLAWRVSLKEGDSNRTRNLVATVLSVPLAPRLKPFASPLGLVALTAPAGRCTKTLWREVRDDRGKGRSQRSLSSLCLHCRTFWQGICRSQRSLRSLTLR